ncbi:ABC transporter ATP-binding protein [Flavobacteriaceae bacterium]|nr:ABC transporter ATP-binding protein [Flavobacteriaceae bacterium]MDB2673082.1 ABC transporter ATP-binding protein [Flavobacteriaceae bacterium]MDB9886173.1 ABC transporter ATP-binding protein [Flavobacteriaceae bacterium]MDC0013951.1 ABC transporter ATP-binding protein [Flavobacteriaceae bacterium]
MAKQIEKPLLSLEKLSLALSGKTILHDISFNLNSNEILAVVGESGSGKSVTAQAIMGLLPPKKTQVKKGSIQFNGKNLLTQTSSDWQQLRGKEIGMIFQEPQSSLNPSMRCGKQVAEMGRQHFFPSLPKKELKEKVLSAFEEVQLPDPERVFNAYPHQLSGGQKQRVMIAMALLCQPKLLIADEPTTALDVLVQQDIIQLIKHLQKQNNMSVLFISHDLSLVANLADTIAVMQEGKLVEIGETKEIFASPKHPYTQGLLGARPATSQRVKWLPTLADFNKNTYHPQPILTEERSLIHKDIYAQTPILSVKGVVKNYTATGGLFGKAKETTALKNISFDLFPGETLGLVGASGCGKSTLAKALVFLDPPSAGDIYWEGKRIDPSNKKQINQLRKDVQFIFQDPYAALHPLKQLGTAIEEVLLVHTNLRQHEREKRCLELLVQVGLSADFVSRYPHELSGGQRQRVVIARALAVEPKVLLCDESVAALDISVQAQVLNLLNELKEKLQLSYLFISHDLAVVKHMADKIIVMHEGIIVEENEADALYQGPQTNFSKKLLEAIPERN